MNDKTETKKRDVSISPVPSEGNPTGFVVQFRDGTEIRRDFASFADDVRSYAEFFGYSNRLMNAAALSREKYPSGIPISAKIEAIQSVLETLDDGEWSSRGEGSGGSNAGLLLETLVRVTGKSRDTLKEWLSTKTQADKLGLLNSPKFKSTADMIRAERAASRSSGIDLGSLENELEGL